MRSSLRSLLLLGALTLGACQAAPPKNAGFVGSERGNVVVLAVTPDTGRLKYAASNLDEATLVELARLAPNVDFVVGASEAELLEHAAEFHGADAHLLSEAFLARATNLVWAQSWSAGVERYLALDGVAGDESLVLTNMKGAHGPVIAEHVMAMLLSLCRDLPAFQRAQERGEWDRGAGAGQRSLAGATLLVVGMGGIGTEVARRADAFDMRVFGTVRTPRAAPAFVDELGTDEDLERFLGEADVVVICLPLTSETRDSFGAETFAKMKDAAILVNIARGPIVDQAALLAALESGKLAGACLDVADPEPLPPGDPLWSRADVLITPHVAAVAALTGARREQLFVENVRRFGAGEPLRNVVDKAAGY